MVDGNADKNKAASGDDREGHDQLVYWHQVILGLGQNANISNAEKNLITVNSIPAVFGDDDDGVVLNQIYEIGNKIIPWAPNWDGASGGNFFRTYQNFVQDITPDKGPDSTPETKAEMDKIQDQIASIQSRAGGLIKDQIDIYMQDNCLEVDNSGKLPKCITPVPGAPSLPDYLKSYRLSEGYKQKVEALDQEFDSDLEGLQNAYDKLATKYYGSNYEQIAEARRVLGEADPENLFASKAETSERRKMTINENGDEREVPRFVSANISSYKQWVSSMQDSYDNGDDPGVVISVKKVEDKSSVTSHSVSGSATIPVSWFFQVNAAASEKTQKIDIDKYEFSAILGYQGLYNLSIEPSDSWYFDNLLKLYSKYYDDHPDLTLSGQKLWGPDGKFAMRVTSVVIGFAPYLQFSCSHYTDTEFHQSWSASSSFGIGPFHFASASSSGSTDKVHSTQSDNGFEVRDVSGIPKIVAITVDTPNYNFETGKIDE